MVNVLDTGVGNSRNVDRYIFGAGSIGELGRFLSTRRELGRSNVFFFVDEYFKNHPEPIGSLPLESGDQLIYVSTVEEPTTEGIDNLLSKMKPASGPNPCAVVGIGGGITLDTSKAISNLLTNGGSAKDYQGWDLVKVPGIYKIGVPTLSGTGAETTRTCIMTNKDSGLKLGMNSDFTVFDQLILDPDLTATVPKNQYFYTGMDAWIHCIESMSGTYRNPIGDAFSAQSIQLSREVFNADEMMNAANREKLMVASYLGGCAIATSYVGLVHPFSAGLSVVLNLHHCIANCIAMGAMEEFYPTEHREFSRMVECQNINIPQGVCSTLSEKQYQTLYQATIIHEKPLTNALGKDFRKVLLERKVRKIFEKM